MPFATPRVHHAAPIQGLRECREGGVSFGPGLRHDRRQIGGVAISCALQRSHCIPRSFTTSNENCGAKCGAEN
jgi:hypothetical protein